MAEVSVVVSAFNNADFIEEAIRSTLDQSFADLEIIIVDSASEDATPDIVNQFQDRRIRYINLPVNCPIPLKRNLGICSGSGEYIAAMDADDIMHPGRLETQVAFLRENPDVDIVGSNFLAFGDDWMSRRRQPADDPQIKARLLLCDGSAIHNPTVMMRRRHLEENALFYPIRRTDEDHALWLDCLKTGTVFANIQQDLLRYRKHPKAYTAVHQDAYTEGKLGIRSGVLQALFETLTEQECDAIARLMTLGDLQNPSDQTAAELGKDKIRRARTCRHGADLKLVQRILARVFKRQSRSARRRPIRS